MSLHLDSETILLIVFCMAVAFMLWFLWNVTQQLSRRYQDARRREAASRWYRDDPRAITASTASPRPTMPATAPREEEPRRIRDGSSIGPKLPYQWPPEF